MAWSTKGAIIGDLHGLQVNRHYPHHSPFICSFWEQDLSILQDFLRIYGFEGAAPKEGEDVTRIYESSYRRFAKTNFAAKLVILLQKEFRSRKFCSYLRTQNY